MTRSPTSLVWTLALFFGSGATSLVYEVLWSRRLSLTFGHTVFAVSTVLTVFMTGLALGSFLAGRWSDQERKRLVAAQDPRGGARFLALYGYLEIFIGLWAVLSLLLLDGVEWLFLSAARGGATGGSLHLLLFVGSFLVLLPPTTAMGATLPAFTQMLVVTRRDVGEWLSRIYGWNTLGACFGAALGGFVLLPTLGLVRSVFLAAFGNLAIGLLAIAVAKRGAKSYPPKEEGKEERTATAHTGGSWLLPVAFGLSGFAAMVYQLGWTRGLILSIGSSTYSFSIILTAFLGSLGLGSLIYKRTLGKRVPSLAHLAGLQFLIAFSSLGATYAIGRLPQIMVKVIPALNYDFLKILLFDFALATALMLIPTVAMGLTFPLVTHLYTDRMTSLGRRLGEAYAANTLGAILGSFLAGFLLVPTLGAQRSLLGAVILNLLVGAALLLGQSTSALKNRLLVSVGVVAVGLGLVLGTPSWDPSQLSAGAGIYARSDHFLFRPAYYKDGVSATVTVGYNGPHSPYLKVNGKVDASLGVQDMAHQVLTGLLPAALHENPRKVALVGLGSGVTAAALVALESIEMVRCAELEPAIVEVQERYFAPYTENILDHPKLDLEVNDGRTFILGAPGRFDLIISQPSNPWIAGIGNLYTEDFYRACLERLEPGGLMCQWFQLYSVSTYDLNLVLSTFFEVFPEGKVFQIGPGDIFLVGSREPLEFRSERLEELWAEERVAYWFQLLGLIEPDFLYGTFVAERDQVMKRLAESPIGGLNTDDRPLLEFQAPRSLYLQDPKVSEYPQSFASLVPKEQEANLHAWSGALLGRVQLGRWPGLASQVKKALEKAVPRSPLAAAMLAQHNNELMTAEGYLRNLSLDEALTPSTQILLGDLRRREKDWTLGLIHYQAALEDPPVGSLYILLMRAGECAYEDGQFELASEYFDQAADLSGRPEPLYFGGLARLVGIGDVEEAQKRFEASLSRDPYDYLSAYRLAQISQRRGDLEMAERYARRSYEAFPEMLDNVEMLMTLAASRGENREALRLQSELNNLRRRVREGR